jgi:hypothetical protein
MSVKSMKEDTNRLLKLLDDPQEGLITWQIAVIEVINDIADYR